MQLNWRYASTIVRFRLSESVYSSTEHWATEKENLCSLSPFSLFGMRGYPRGVTWSIVVISNEAPRQPTPLLSRESYRAIGHFGHLSPSVGTWLSCLRRIRPLPFAGVVLNIPA